MKHRNESKKKRRPDHEAVGVEVSADTISDPEYFHRFEGDGGNRSKATGNIVVVIRRQHKGSVDKDVRPDNNEVLYGEVPNLCVRGKGAETDWRHPARAGAPDHEGGFR